MVFERSVLVSKCNLLLSVFHIKEGYFPRKMPRLPIILLFLKLLEDLLVSLQLYYYYKIVTRKYSIAITS